MTKVKLAYEDQASEWSARLADELNYFRKAVEEEHSKIGEVINQEIKARFDSDVLVNKKYQRI